MLQIRPARAADLRAVKAIVQDSYAPYVACIGAKPAPMLDDYAVLIGKSRVFLLSRDRDILGLVVLIPEADAMLLDNIAVRPGDQGRGYGRRLLQFSEKAARDAGFSCLRLYTNEAMTENIALYARAGFIETHRAEERGLRRVYMAKPLASSTAG